MFAALSVVALVLAGGMAVVGPPTTFDPVGSAAHEKPTVEYVAQNAGKEQILGASRFFQAVYMVYVF